MTVDGETEGDKAGELPSERRVRLGWLKLVPADETLGSEMEMMFEMREVHEDSVESVLG
jgi:hypothetical protein